VAIYLSALSSGLVAIGIASSSPRALAALAFTVLPTVFVLGWFTVVRLTDTSVANVVSLRRMELIRSYYASLTPSAAAYFEADDSVTGTHGVRYSRWSYLFTMASMVIVINSVLGGATAALVGMLAINAPIAASTAAGIAVGLVLLALSLRYEHQRLMPVVFGPLPRRGRQNGDDPELTRPVAPQPLLPVPRSGRHVAGGQLRRRGHRWRCQVKVGVVTSIPGVVTSLVRRDGTLPACGFRSTMPGAAAVRA
jgi:hypothetical protein